jgi:hypothetical protein
MKLVPLKYAYGQRDSNAANTVIIRCIMTGKRNMWYQAVDEHWVCDLDGKPFAAYYSPEGVKLLNDRA